MKYLASLCLAGLLLFTAACGGFGGSANTGGNNNNGGTGGTGGTGGGGTGGGGTGGGGTGGGGTGGGGGSTPPPADIHAVNHILIMFQENRSFDSYFGFMTDYRTKNSIPINSADGNIRDLSDPAAQVAASKNISPATGEALPPKHFGSVCTEDLTPDWGETHKEMNLQNSAAAGPTSPMDGFVDVAYHLNADFLHVLADKDGHRAMGIFDDHDLNFYYFMASNFAMGDMMFSPAPTRTTSNRLYIHAATSQGRVHADEDAGGLTAKTIWRALDEKGVTWKIYVSDWGKNNFSFFDDFTDSGNPKLKANVVSIDQYFADVQAGTLPQVAFIETGMNTGRDEHPSNNPGPDVVAPPINVQVGAAWVEQVVQALVTSGSWKDSAFFLAFDEGGGAFDHVPPIKVPSPDGIKPKDLFANDPAGDFTISGFRIPNFIVSPFAKKNFVSHTPMDYTAILKFVETRFGLDPLTARDAAMPDMTEFFDFNNGGPWATPPANIPVQNRDGICDYSKQ